MATWGGLFYDLKCLPMFLNVNNVKHDVHGHSKVIKPYPLRPLLIFHHPFRNAAAHVQTRKDNISCSCMSAGEEGVNVLEMDSLSFGFDV